MKCRICDNEERPEGHACALGTPENERHRLTWRERNEARVDNARLRAENAKLRVRPDEAEQILRAAPLKMDPLEYFERWHKRANAHLLGAPAADSPVAGEPRCAASGSSCEDTGDPETFCDIEQEGNVACAPGRCALRPVTLAAAPDNGMLAPVLANLDQLRREVWTDAVDMRTTIDALAAKVTALEAGMNMHSDCIGKLSEWAKTREKSPFREHPAAPPAPVAEPVHHSRCESRINPASPCDCERWPETAGPGHGESGRPCQVDADGRCEWHDHAKDVGR